MRAPNNKRMRGGGNNRKHLNPKTQSFDSNGPDVKVRGNAQQVVEKYLLLARDASSAGDRITAESYYQHAEHYFRILNATNAANERRNAAPEENAEASPQVAKEAAAEEKAGSAANNGNNGARPSNGKGSGKIEHIDGPQPSVEIGRAAGADPAP